jgi:hypothetical protein
MNKQQAMKAMEEFEAYYHNGCPGYTPNTSRDGAWCHCGKRAEDHTPSSRVRMTGFTE